MNRGQRTILPRSPRPARRGTALVGRNTLLAFVALALRAATVRAQITGWDLLPDPPATAIPGNNAYLVLNPDTGLPFVVQQENTTQQSHGKIYGSATWTPYAGSIGYGSGWIHVAAFGHAAGQAARTPFVFFRDYGWGSGGRPVGDGTLAYWDASGTAPHWVRSTVPATSDASHYLWLDIQNADPQAPLYDVPVVSFADRQYNAGWPANPALIDEDPLVVARYALAPAPGQSPWQPIGTAGLPGPARLFTGASPPPRIGPARYTGVKVSRSGAVYAAYTRFSAATGDGHANVVRWDPATDTFVTVGGPDFSCVTVAGMPILAAANLRFELDQADVPWVAFMYGPRVVVMRFDPPTASWAVVGGFASGPDLALLPDASWRYRVGLAFDPANRPYVLYSLYAAVPATQSKAVVRRFRNGAWEAVGTPGFTPNGASYLSLDIDPYGSVYAACRDMMSGRLLTWRFTNPLMVNGPQLVGTGCSTSPAFPVPLLGTIAHPEAGQTWACSLAGAQPNAAGLLFLSRMGDTPWNWNGCLSWSTPWTLSVLGPFSTNAVGGAVFPFAIPASAVGYEGLLEAAVFDGVDTAVSNGLRTIVTTPGYAP